MPDAHRGRKRAVDPLDLKLQVVERHLVSVRESEPRSSARESSMGSEVRVISPATPPPKSQVIPAMRKQWKGIPGLTGQPT